MAQFLKIPILAGLLLFASVAGSHAENSTVYTENSTGYSGGDVSSGGDFSNQKSPTQMSAVAIGNLLTTLQNAQKFCQIIKNVSPEYTIDCISERLAYASRQIAYDRNFAEISKALSDAADKLNGIAQQNRNQSAKSRRYKSGGQRNTRALTPVTQANIYKANAQARAVIEETQVVLLRSSEGSEKSEAQFQQIAAAVGSNKVLLRTIS